MLTKIISKDDALALITKSEDHFFDQKAKEVSGAKVQRALVAFGNADGGELIVGVADAKVGTPKINRWHGHAAIEDFNGVLQAINGIQPSLPCSTAFLALSGSARSRVARSSRQEFARPQDECERCVHSQRSAVSARDRPSAADRPSIREATSVV
jgi:hypothetical protein